MAHNCGHLLAVVSPEKLGKINNIPSKKVKLSDVTVISCPHTIHLVTVYKLRWFMNGKKLIVNVNCDETENIDCPTMYRSVFYTL